MPKLPSTAHSLENANTPEIRCKIDYYTFTSGALHVYDTDTGETFTDASQYAQRACSAANLAPLAGHDRNLWSAAPGRSGYAHGARHPIGAYMLWRHAVAKPLLELPGSACDLLHGAAALLPLVLGTGENCTRIDLAADIRTEMTPADFLSYGRSARHRTSRNAKSETGLTEYIGSPTSDRSAKVYRYAEPHPRAAWLRVEITLRRKQARAAACALRNFSLPAVLSAAADPFDFKCPQWRLPAKADYARPTMVNEPTAASRLRWLEKQIRPAVCEAHRTGLIDLREWLASIDA